MDRSVEKIDESHNRMRFKFNSFRERDEWMKTFLYPMPSTHRFVFRWDESLTELICEPEPNTKPQVKPDPHSPARDKIIAELSGIDRANLETRAVESGVTVNKKWSDAQLRAAIADKLAPAKAA